VLEFLYIAVAALLALYGLNSFLLSWLYLRHRREEVLPGRLTEAPPVTVQLPIYNELYVAKRLLEAVVRLDYPRHKLQIQVLDDSDDETTSLVRALVESFRAQGVDIELLHRRHRKGFKAGALQEGLARAKGEFIAVFDADFLPPPDFLHRVIPHLLTRPRLGMVQARWGHLNAQASALTGAQALALDGHFVVEQTARNRAGLFMNFNGSAGVWRRRCIEEAGGWQADTLSEDLDLSYRAQLLGWECLYLPDVVVPAEIPLQIQAFKRQQARWAQGSIQCVLKLGRKVLASPYPLFKRWQALMHLSGYLIHPLMLLLLFLTLPIILGDFRLPWPLAYLGLSSLGPPLTYALSQRALYPRWWRRLVYLPYLALIGVGIALSNSLAIGRALLRRKGEFQRTPKFGGRRRKRYWLGIDGTVWGELALTLYALLLTLTAWNRGAYGVLPFLALYVAGFGLVSLLSLREGLTALIEARRSAPGQPSLAKTPFLC